MCKYINKRISLLFVFTIIAGVISGCSSYQEVDMTTLYSNEEIIEENDNIIVDTKDNKNKNIGELPKDLVFKSYGKLDYNKDLTDEWLTYPLRFYATQSLVIDVKVPKHKSTIYDGLYVQHSKDVTNYFDKLVNKTNDSISYTLSYLKENTDLQEFNNTGLNSTVSIYAQRKEIKLNDIDSFNSEVSSFYSQFKMLVDEKLSSNDVEYNYTFDCGENYLVAYGNYITYSADKPFSVNKDIYIRYLTDFGFIDIKIDCHVVVLNEDDIDSCYNECTRIIKYSLDAYDLSGVFLKYL